MFQVGSIIGGILPILLFAWIFRKLFGATLTTKTALWSVGAALAVGIIVYGFMEGEGGFTNRLVNIGSADSFVIYVPAALIAFVLCYLVALGRSGQHATEDE